MDPTTALHIQAEQYQSGHHLHVCILVSIDISAIVSQVYLEISNDFLFSLTSSLLPAYRGLLGVYTREGLSL